MRFEPISNLGSIYKPVIPTRSTKHSAGYDFSALRDTIVPPHGIALIPTGIKAQIDDGYYLQLAVRSSTPKKKGLILANGIGIVDGDYYNNPDNEGHIMFQVFNTTDKEVLVVAGERIGQGVFLKYAVTDDDSAEGERLGGFGSTGVK